MSERYSEKYSSTIDCVSIPFKNVKENNDVFRIDAEYFGRKALELDEKIRKGRFFLLKDYFDISKLAGFEFTLYFTKQNMNSDDSYIALTSKNIQTENLVINEYITIDKKTANEFLSRSKILRNDIILSYTGEYRRSLVIQDGEYQLGPNVCRLRPIKDDAYSFFISLYLNSDLGQLLLDREKTLSAQPTVAMSRIREIPVPFLNDNIVCGFKKLYLEMFSLKKASKEKISEAETLINAYLGFDSFEIKNEVNEIYKFSESVLKYGRLDPEYYQYKYSKILAKIKEQYKTKPIRDLVEIKDSTLIPIDDELYKYLELSSVDDNCHIVDFTENYGNKLPTRARRFVQQDDVLVSSILGSMQTIAMVNKEFDGSLCSNGFFVCKAVGINPQIFVLLLKNPFINQLLQQQCTGTILMGSDKNDFGNIELPILSEENALKLTKLFNRSMLLFDYSEYLLKEMIDLVNHSMDFSENTLEEKITKLYNESQDYLKNNK